MVRLAAIGLAVVGAGAFGVSRLRGGARAKETLGRIVTVERGDLTVRVSETGTLEAVTKVDVKSRVAGRLQRIYVRAGDRVSAGDPLAIVDPTEVSREVAGVKAQLSASRAGLTQSEVNLHLTERQNALAIRRAEVAVENARVGLRDALVGLQTAENGVLQAQSRLTQAAAPTRSQEVEQAEASIARITAQLADARRLYERRKILVAKGFVAQQEADSAQTQVQLAESDLASARERVGLLREGPRQEDIATVRVGVDAARIAVDQSKVRVAQARVQIRSAEVELETARANAAQSRLRAGDVARSRADVAQIENRLAQQSVQLTETRIVAPISGEITGKYVEEGELVASATAGFAQGAALVTIADLSRMQVRVNVNEVDVARLQVGQPVDVRVDGVSGKTFQGQVTAIAPASLSNSQAGQTSQSAQANTVVRFEVKITVTDRDLRLRPGMTAAVDIILNRHRSALLLPAEALRPGDKVMVVTGTKESPVRTERSVRPGLRDEAHVEILSGLTEKDRVEVPPLDAKDRRRINLDGPN
jgi:HlyD family secretion protein